MRFLPAAISLILLGMLGCAKASYLELTGTIISGSYDYSCVSSCVPVSFGFSTNPMTDGPGVEFILTVNGHSTLIDFGPLSLTLTAQDAVTYPPGLFDGPIFSIVSGDHFNAITTWSVDGGPVSVSSTSTQVSINLEGATFNAGGGVEITFAPDVPEPSTWAMLLIGFAAVGFAGYRRSHQSAPL